MPGRFIEHHSAHDTEWSWEREDDANNRVRRKRSFTDAFLGFVFVGGVVAMAFGFVLILTSGSGNAALPPPASATPTPGPTAVATPAPSRSSTQTPQPTATLAPTPPPGQQFDAQLAAWSDIKSEWLTTALDQETSGYRAGEFVPFLLRIDDAKPGTTYDLQITYECFASGKPAIDFIAGIELDHAALLQTSLGPGSVTPDSVLSQLDDSSLNFDDQHGWFWAWGAAFSRAAGPLPQTECESTKTLSISILAQDETVILVWAGHLASPADWGEGNDAASAAPFSIVVEIDGWSLHSLTMVPGSVAE